MKKGLRLVATVTLVCFLTTQSVWGAPAAGIEIAGGRELPAYLSIDVPAELGTVDTLYEAPASANPQFILHIQNAHANYQAQMKIKQLLGYMNKKYGFKTIFVEGASEKLDADYLRLFPDQERNLKLCDELAKQGELTGAELFLMEANKDVEGLPIEQAALYRSNYGALKKVFGAQADVTRFFTGFDGKLDKVASKTFTPETRELIADWKRFEQGRREFMPFVQTLAKKSKKILKTDLESLFAQVGWPQISRLLVIQQMEKDLNKKKGVEEQAALIKMLRTKGVSKELLATLENFNEGSIAVGKSATEVSPREVLERLADEAGPRGFKFSDYPAFSLYAGYVTLRSELDSKVLFEEIEYLFTQMLDTLAGEPDQKALLALYRDGELLRKLLHLELNRTQWREVVEAKERVAIPSLVSRLKEAIIASRDSYLGTRKDKSPVSRLQSVSDVMPKAFGGKMDELFNAGLEFYDFAHKREAVFYKEMHTAMAERKITKAILITGGFHTDGMSDMFRDNAISYGIVTPRLSEKSDENLYRKIMLQNEERPFSISYLEAAIMMQDPVALIAQLGAQGFSDKLAGFINSLTRNGLDLKSAVDEINAKLDPKLHGRFAPAGRVDGKPFYKWVPANQVGGVPDITVAEIGGTLNVQTGSIAALNLARPEAHVAGVPEAVAQPAGRSEARSQVFKKIGLSLGLAFILGSSSVSAQQVAARVTEFFRLSATNGLVGSVIENTGTNTVEGNYFVQVSTNLVNWVRNTNVFKFHLAPRETTAGYVGVSTPVAPAGFFRGEMTNINILPPQSAAKVSPAAPAVSAAGIAIPDNITIDEPTPDNNNTLTFHFLKEKGAVDVTNFLLRIDAPDAFFVMHRNSRNGEVEYARIPFNAEGVNFESRQVPDAWKLTVDDLERDYPDIAPKFAAFLARSEVRGMTNEGIWNGIAFAASSVIGVKTALWVIGLQVVSDGAAIWGTAAGLAVALPLFFFSAWAMHRYFRAQVANVTNRKVSATDRFWDGVEAVLTHPGAYARLAWTNFLSQVTMASILRELDRQLAEGRITQEEHAKKRAELEAKFAGDLGSRSVGFVMSAGRILTPGLPTIPPIRSEAGEARLVAYLAPLKDHPALLIGEAAKVLGDEDQQALLRSKINPKRVAVAKQIVERYTSATLGSSNFLPPNEINDLKTFLVDAWLASRSEVRNTREKVDALLPLSDQAQVRGQKFDAVIDAVPLWAQGAGFRDFIRPLLPYILQEILQNTVGIPFTVRGREARAVLKGVDFSGAEVGQGYLRFQYEFKGGNDVYATQELYLVPSSSHKWELERGLGDGMYIVQKHDAGQPELAKALWEKTTSGRSFEKADARAVTGDLAWSPWSLMGNKSPVSAAFFIPAARSEAKPSEAAGQAKKKILVVEDEEQLRQLSVIVLERMGYDVVTAVDGIDAIAKFKVGEFALVMTDWQMPEMNGEKLIAEIRRFDPLQKVLVVSGGDRHTNSESAAKMAQQFGTRTFFLGKPYHPNDLVAKVGESLRSELRSTVAQRQAELAQWIEENFKPQTLETLKAVTSDALSKMGISESDLGTPQLRVAVALMRGIVSSEKLEAVAPLLITIASLVDARTLTGLRDALAKATGVTVPVSSERGDAVKALDGLTDVKGLLDSLEFNLLLNPNIAHHIIVWSKTGAEQQAVNETLAWIKYWAQIKNAPMLADQVQIKVFSPSESAKAMVFLAGVKSYVISGTTTAIGRLNADRITGLVIEETEDVQAPNSQVLVMNVTSRAATVIGSMAGPVAAMIELLKQQPDSGFVVRGSRLEINATTLNVLRNIQALFEAFKTIAKAA